MNVETVRADTGLPRIPELGGHRTFDRRIDIRICEDDKRCIAAEFERDSLYRGRALCEQQFAYGGRARERKLPDYRVARQFGAGTRAGRSGHHVEDPGRQPGSFSEGSERQGAQRGRLRRLDNQRTTCRQGGCALAGQHRQRGVRRCNGSDHPYRLTDHDIAAIGIGRRNYITVSPAGLLGEPLEIACCILDFTARLLEGLALLGSD